MGTGPSLEKMQEYAPRRRAIQVSFRYSVNLTHPRRCADFLRLIKQSLEAGNLKERAMSAVSFLYR